MQATIHTRDGDGDLVIWTITDADLDLLKAQKLTEAVPIFKKVLAQAGYTITDAQPQPMQAASTPNSEGSFPTREITLAPGEERDYIKIRGGKYMKWGVNIWEEVLEQYPDLPLPNIRKRKLPLDGWIAYHDWEEGEDGEPRPGRVTRLERVRE